MPNTTTPPTPPKKRIGVRSLKSAADVQRLLSRLIKARLSGDIDDNMLKSITYTTGMLLKAIDQGLTDQRLADIEKQLADLEEGNQ